MVLCAATQGWPKLASRSHMAGELHMPPLQVCPLLQAMPHMPQFSGLLIRSTHAPEQAVSAVGVVAQVAAQAPSEQTCPAAHAIPHIPQFAGSDFVSTQVVLPLQRERPPVQAQAPD